MEDFMNILVLSKPEFNDLMNQHIKEEKNVDKEPFSKIAFISINDTSGMWGTSWFSEDHPNVLRLWFDDTSKDGVPSPTIESSSTKAMTIDQAKQIVEFIKKNKDAKQFIVHCSAGISRSGAVGEFIADYIGFDRNEFLRDNPAIHPSPYVSSLLKRVLWEK